MIEPTGLMDNKRQQLQFNEDPPTSDFSICDLGDEEVHFSRHSSDYYYYKNDERRVSSVSDHYNKRNSSSALDNQATGSSTASSSKMARKASSATIHSLDVNHFQCSFHNQQQTHHNNNNEQISSSRLLNSLGNKLRRGSNYLNAPTKLLGQYLLGITIRNWSEFFNTARMMKAPGNRHQLTRRLMTNLSYFQGNYLCVSLILVVYCILTTPLLLIAIGAYLVILYLVTARSALGKQTKILGYRLNLQQQYSFITMLSVPFLWIAGAPSAVFWVIGASFFVVGLHASMFANEQCVVTEQHLFSSSRAAHSLAIHTPTYDLNQQAGLSSQNSSKPPTVQYYNHYPGVAIGGKGYTPVSQLSPTKVSPPSSGAPLALGSSSSSSASGGYVLSSAISQWIPFTSGRSSSSQIDTMSTTSSNHQQVRRGPEVNIISRDYAGLGRVWEV